MLTSIAISIFDMSQRGRLCQISQDRGESARKAEETSARSTLWGIFEMSNHPRKMLCYDDLFSHLYHAGDFLFCLLSSHIDSPFYFHPSYREEVYHVVILATPCPIKFQSLYALPHQELLSNVANITYVGRQQGE